MIIIIFQTFDCFLFSAYISFCWILLLCIFKHHIKRSLDALFGGPFLGISQWDPANSLHCRKFQEKKSRYHRYQSAWAWVTLNGGRRNNGSLCIFPGKKRSCQSLTSHLQHTPFFGPTTILGWSNHNSSTDLTEIMYRRSLNRPLLVPFVGTK